MPAKNAWTDEEDDLIRKLVGEMGQSKWSQISDALKRQCRTTRSGKQCRTRWLNHLDPSINRAAWTDDEERTIYERQKVDGNKWAVIAKHLPGR
jgi:myb proto-oncogene protein